MSLAEALDRMLHCGVAVQGNVAVGLAGVDLLFLDLRVLLASIDTIWPNGMPSGLMTIGGPNGPISSAPPSLSEAAAAAQPAVAEASGLSPTRDEASARNLHSAATRLELPDAEANPTPAKGLVRLVLTLVKLLHDVMERQALRRMDHDRLSAAEIEAVGMALCTQATEIERLRHLFGFSERDLALDLGLFDGAT